LGRRTDGWSPSFLAAASVLDDITLLAVEDSDSDADAEANAEADTEQEREEEVESKDEGTSRRTLEEGSDHFSFVGVRDCIVLTKLPNDADPEVVEMLNSSSKTTTKRK
jgi:hypothetical protein